MTNVREVSVKDEREVAEGAHDERFVAPRRPDVKLRVAKA
jgi:hypothetical protein